MCSSGDHNLKAGEDQQLDFNKQLEGIFQAQFGQQSAILSYLKDKMTGAIENPQGYSPEALAGMRTAATEGTSRAYAQAQQATNQATAAHGGSALPSGVNAQLNAENANAAAAFDTGAQNQITQANENLKQSNYWNAINVLGGTSAQFNPQSYASEFNQGQGTLGSLGGALQNSKQGGFWNTFKQGLGSGLSAGLTGGIGTGVSKIGNGEYGF